MESVTETPNDYTALLDKLQAYVDGILASKTTVDRKLLDTLLGAINIQVQKEPHSVRKLILDKQLVLPNSISFPPSQVVDAVIEHDADMQISKVLNNMFADDRIKLSDPEKRDRQQFRSNYPAPSMTRMLVDIGQELVQEATYSDIVHARNLPETPKNLDTYKQVAAQLKPVWENLRDKNASFKLKAYSCSACGFKTENLTLMSVHKQQIHMGDNKRIQCGMCPEFNTNGTRMHRHYLEKHGLIPLLPEDPPAKIQCSLCEQDFQYKGQRDAHLKVCKREAIRLSRLQETRMPEHSSMINRWLWSRPPADPVIQQDLQKQQAAKQQQQRANAQASRAVAPQARPANPPAPKIAPAQQQPKAQQPSPNLDQLSSILASQKFQSQLRNLDSTQQKQLEQILQSRQASFPPNVVAALQSQLRAIQSPAQSTPVQPAQPAQPAPTPTQAQTSAVAKALTQMGMGVQLNKLSPQVLQRFIQQQQQAASSSSANRSPGQKKLGTTSSPRPAQVTSNEMLTCEICDKTCTNKREHCSHMQVEHSLLRGRIDIDAGPPLACSRCRERFWSYEGLERHLMMNHDLVTSDLLQKAQNKLDGGRCKHCKKSFAFNILQHLATDHGSRLCSAEIVFSCDVCTFKSNSYTKLEAHLSDIHPKTGMANKSNGVH